VYLILWLPLIVAVVGTGYFLHFTDADFKWKALAAALTGTSLVLQLMPSRVPFVVPLILQGIVALWMAIYWKLEQ